MTFVTALLFILLGILTGMVLTYFIMPKDSGQEKALQKQLKESNEAFALYRTRVSSDYVKTADLLNQMTESYREVHRHLAESANTLCADAAEQPKLDLLTRASEHYIEAVEVQGKPQEEARWH